MEALTVLLDRSTELHLIVSELLDQAPYDGSQRGMAVLGMCAISIEHAGALQLLIAGGLPTSGVSMMRPQAEALIRAVWLSHAASDEQVTKLTAPLTLEAQQAARRVGETKDMLRDLVAKGPPGAARLLSRFYDRLWPGLNSFAHGGIHPLKRKLDGYPEPLIVDLVKNSNAVVLLTALVLAELSDSADMVELVAQLNHAFEDCVPAMEPFPDTTSA